MEKKGDANQNHRMQLWIYLYELGIKEGSIFYISKDDMSISEYPVFLNDKKLEKEVFNELKILNNCWKKKILPPLAPAGSWQAKYCRWHKKCLEFEEASIDRVKL